jgi:hypothetical protein
MAERELGIKQLITRRRILRGGYLGTTVFSSESFVVLARAIASRLETK